MAIDHAAITDPNIHEPKGIDSTPANCVYVANGTGSGAWQQLPQIDPELQQTPVGAVIDWPTNTAPSKWALCYGQAISRTTYSALFARLGTTFGSGDGSTTFNLPDCRGRVIAGNDSMGGISANRLTNQNGGVEGDVSGSVGGNQVHTLVLGEIPAFTGTTSEDGSHTHSLNNATSVVRSTGSGDGSSNNTVTGPVPTTSDLSLALDPAHTHTISINSGGGGSHTNTQPTFILNKIIYHGVA